MEAYLYSWSKEPLKGVCIKTTPGELEKILSSMKEVVEGKHGGRYFKLSGWPEVEFTFDDEQLKRENGW